MSLTFEPYMEEIEEQIPEGEVTYQVDFYEEEPAEYAYWSATHYYECRVFNEPHNMTEFNRSKIKFGGRHECYERT